MKTKYTRSVTVRMTEEEYQTLKEIKKALKKPASELMRDSIQFYASIYSVLN